MPRSSPARRVPEASLSAVTPLAGRDPGAAKAGSFAAEVVEVTRRGLSIRRPGELGAVTEARLSLMPWYRPTAGDTVIVAWVGDQATVVGVLASAELPALVLPDGAIARVVGGALEVADPAGRLLVRYVDGTAEIAPPAGDLRLSAPTGRVHIAAGIDVAIEASRDVTISAQRAAETKIAARDAGGDTAEGGMATRLRLDGKGATLAAPEVEVRGRRARLTAGLAEAVAREIKTSATRIETTASAIETRAERIAIHAQSIVQEVTELLETKAGRVRSIVRGAFSLRAKSTTMKSKDDTAIDGRRVLLG